MKGWLMHSVRAGFLGIPQAPTCRSLVWLAPVLLPKLAAEDPASPGYH